MKTKRLTAFLLCALLAAVPALSVRAETPDPDTQQWLLSRALSLLETMDACARDGEYAKLYPAAEVSFSLIRGTDWQRPSGATLYLVRDQLYEVYLAASRVDFSALSGPARQKLREAIPASLHNLMNAGADSGFLTAVSALRCGKVFLSPPAGLPEASVLYLQYPGGTDAVCSFVLSEEGTVSAYVCPVLKDGVSRLMKQLRLLPVKESDLFEALPLPL